MMGNLGYPLLMLSRVTLAFVTMYILVPTWLSRPEPPADGVWDRMFAGLINVSFLTILIVYILVFSRLYETFSLLTVYALVLLLLFRRRSHASRDGLEEPRVGFLTRMLDLAEDNAGITHGLASYAKRKLAVWAKDTWQRWHSWLLDPFVLVLPGIIIVWSAIIRLQYSLHHAAYSLSDPYEHLAWVKYLGMNRVYQDGIYPQGYHTLVSAMNQLTYIDPYWMVRFLGGIGATLLVVSIYHFTLRLTKDHGASLIALAVYGLVSDARFPSMLLRQQAFLPQEFALVFGWPALYFLTLYLREHRRSHLMLFVEAFAITLLVHPYTTLYLTIWASVQVLVSLMLGQASLRQIGMLVIYGVPASLLGVSPYIIGLLLGYKWFGAAFAFVTSNVGPTGPPPSGAWWTHLISGNPYLDLLLPCCLLAIVAALFRREGRAAKLTTSISATIMLLLYRSGDLGLPQLSEQSRTGTFLAPFLAMACGLGVLSLGQLLFLGFRRHRDRLVTIFTRTTALAIVVLIAVYATPPLPAAEPVEYDAAADSYLRIKTEMPVLDWTIIGPSEQYQEAVGIGRHYETLRFVQDFSPAQATDPDFDLPIPTHNIFVFIEKRSLIDQRDVSLLDSNLPLSAAGPDPYTQYYRSAEQRALLMAKAWQFMQCYRQSHDGVSVYYEDENLLVYRIVHEIPENSLGAVIQ